ncbi:DUF5655 domain-containing protein [Candidatus Kirkpatrickella diaphorinae]|uniref:DUF5655 domain-containing protein n=1 Tax=Candidatus Kirkpatrickella diaphorinae TaxID=2984322 RepID=A0ABY6GK93_9PROT|nr:DUF5655 domain-containing protein [Candidatus Kirkpatrickella diaphorinae]UYH51235.1 DUF5655 domain-containing protein [Candidatus Kirkpatrickella diaphorinae]
MTDIQLFRLSNGVATELPSQAAKLERALQSLLEANMSVCLGVRFLASEYKTGKTHKGRIDSLGLDENGYPVIIEYKRHNNENVINQGLFYLDWLLDHRAEFRWLVMEKLGKDAADQIEWMGTRLVCIAADFTRYDQYAVQQIPRNIELLRYKLFDEELLLLELVNSQTVPDATSSKETTSKSASGAPHGLTTHGKDRSVEEWLEMGSDPLRELYTQTASYLNSLGDDVQEKHLKLYTAFRRLKNFACIVVQAHRLLITLSIDPASVSLEEGFSRDVTHVGHWGTGNLEITIRTLEDLERAKPLLERSYCES